MPKRNCLYPSCSDPPSTRGLCKLHYQHAYRLVQGGETTWDQLEKDGKIAPSGSRAGEASDWFLNDKKPTRTRRIRENSK